MKNTIKSVCMGFLLVGTVACNQPAEQPEKINDSNTPLHLLTPDYKVAYKEWNTEQIKSYLDRVLHFLESTTPMRVVDKETGAEITDLEQLNPNAQLERGAFRLASYEWGVTYSGMLAVADATQDAQYMNYAKERFSFLTEMVPYFTRLMNEQDVIDGQMRQIIRPGALDDAGAICAAMIKLSRIMPEIDFSRMILNYMDFIENKEHRLADGTFARMRPQANTMWLDDMYMAIPAIAQMGAYTGDTRYFDEAVFQVLSFSKRMFVEEKGLYMHGWVEGEEYHPAFHWGRANGWALLTLTEVLDVLPADHPGYEAIMKQYKAHVRGIAARQSGEGFWHQLLDRNDSYLETSATAIFTYCIARGINKGWLDVISFGPVAQLGWSAVSTKINAEGEVEDVCVGTGMAFDPAFYYYRPVNVYAAHGYGPVLLAGAEMIQLITRFFPKMNDSAIQYYSVKQDTDRPIFGVK